MRFEDRLEDALTVEKIAWTKVMNLPKKPGLLPIAVNLLRIQHIFGELHKTGEVISCLTEGLFRSLIEKAAEEVPDSFIPEALGYVTGITALVLTCRGEVVKARWALRLGKTMGRMKGAKKSFLMPGLGTSYHALALLELGEWPKVQNAIANGELDDPVQRVKDTGAFLHIRGRVASLAATTNEQRHAAIQILEKAVEVANSNSMRWWKASGILEIGRVLLRSGDIDAASERFSAVLEFGQTHKFALFQADAEFGLAACYRTKSCHELAEQRLQSAKRIAKECRYGLRLV